MGIAQYSDRKLNFVSLVGLKVTCFFSSISNTYTTVWATCWVCFTPTTAFVADLHMRPLITCYVCIPFPTDIMQHLRRRLGTLQITILSGGEHTNTSTDDHHKRQQNWRYFTWPQETYFDLSDHISAAPAVWKQQQDGQEGKSNILLRYML
jgi:hypothetical protein